MAIALNIANQYFEGDFMLSAIERKAIFDAMLVFREAKEKELDREFSEVVEIIEIVIQRWLGTSVVSKN